MRLSSTLLSLFLLGCENSISQAFLIRPNSCHQTSTRPSFLLSSTEKAEDIDDWYADFDPSEFDTADTGNSYSSGSGGGGGGGGGSNSGSPDHDYSRDSQADQSNVDLGQVNYLISERLVLRKTGQFPEADKIRDELLEKHGVLVHDKERTWRTGCSSSGSGSRWGGQSGGRNDRPARGRREPKSFGPNGHDYNLATDAEDSISPLSESEIHALLAERLNCKLSREFRRADAIQDELFASNVLVNDGNKEWRADGKTFDSSTRKYQMSEHSSSTPDSVKIQSLVDERSQAKASRQFGKADALRDELLGDFDVYCDDRLKQWSVGGDFRGKKEWDREFTTFSRSPTSEIPENNDEIQSLVEQRDAARADRDFGTADQIREDLMEQNIHIDDRTRSWSVGGGDFGRPARREPGTFSRRGGGDVSPDDEAAIVELLTERAGYKRARDFDQADRIRDQLRDEFQVRVDDKNQEWHVERSNYIMDLGSAPVDAESKQYIEELIVKRAQAKVAKDYNTADDIRDELTEKYNVSVDDRVKEWIKLPSANDIQVVDAADDEDINADDDEDTDAVEATISEGSESEVDLSQLTVPELKERLRAANLPVSGKKSELIERLSE